MRSAFLRIKCNTTEYKYDEKKISFHGLLKIKWDADYNKSGIQYFLIQILFYDKVNYFLYILIKYETIIIYPLVMAAYDRIFCIVFFE
ncbi:PKD domain containing protein [Chryseobacterium sp. StRB126]|nr:PKD domain containing protein [Chryseobacterium sp. StRB126]